MSTTVVEVPLSLGETARTALVVAGRFDRGFKVSRVGDILRIPVIGRVGECLNALGRDLEVVAAEMDPAKQRPPTWQDLVDLPAGVEFPVSFDLIGTTAIIKFPPSARPYAQRLAAALVESHPRILTVLQDHGITGVYRVRQVEVLIGEARIELHREYGVELEVDPVTVFFSPRLAVERRRIADLILATFGPGARVSDMFAGVGPLTCVVARHAAPATITACELNPAAVELLRRNIIRNRFTGSVTCHQGDTRDLLPGLPRADAYLLNLPFGAAGFLSLVDAHAGTGALVVAYQQRPAGETWQGPVPERWVHQGSLGVKEYAPHEWMMRDWWVVA